MLSILTFKNVIFIGQELLVWSEQSDICSTAGSFIEHEDTFLNTAPYRHVQVTIVIISVITYISAYAVEITTNYI